MKEKISNLVAEFLEQKNIKVAFGIIGSANSHIFESITRRGFTKIVCVHHEQAAVMAMQGYHRASGKYSVAIVTAGAGSSNAITGVLSAWADSIPGMIISGQEPSKFITLHSNLRMYGVQGFNSTKMVSDITKYSKCLLDEKEIQNELEKAYDISLEGRPGPVWLDFPFDIQAKTIEKREWDYCGKEASYTISSSDIDELIDCLRKSERPVIIGGKGIKISNSKELFTQLVNQVKIPTIITWAAIDLLPTANPYNFGRAGLYGQRCGNFVVQNADLILAIGCRMSLLQVGYDISNYAPHAKIFLVDIDNNELHKYEKSFHKLIHTDAGYFIRHLLEQLNGEEFLRKKWLCKCLEWKVEYPWYSEKEHFDDGYINSYRFMSLLPKFMKDDQVIVTDMGTSLLSGHQVMELKENQKMFTSTGLGEMGFGLPAAIGAAFANRGEVLCLNCDGGMMMNLQELQTIITHNLPIKIVIFNNDGYLMIKHTENMLFKGKRFAVNKDTGVSLPNYTSLGDVLGFETYKIRSWNTFEETMTKFMGSKNPCICEVFMHPEQDFVPKVRGTAKEDGTVMPGILEEMSPLLPLEEIEKHMISGINEISKQIKR